MRFLIVAPSYKEERHLYYELPLGIMYISSVLKEAGFEVTCLNLNHETEPLEPLLRRVITSQRIDVLCTGGLSVHYHKIKALFDAARAIKPGIITILGGGILTSEPELMVRSLGATYGVNREGEVTIVALARALSEGRDPAGLPGIVYRGRDGGIVVAPHQPLIKNLDTLPMPDYEGFGADTYLDNLLPNDAYHLFPFDKPRCLPLISSRGCPYSCTFCYQPLTKLYRQRSFDSIAHEGSEYDPYPSNEVIQSDGKYNKVFALHGYFWEPAQINVSNYPGRSGIILGIQPIGARGTLIRGDNLIDSPFEEYSDTIWWKVQYDNGLVGWTIEDFFAPIGRPFRIDDRIQTRAAAPWRTARHVPSNMDEFHRVRDEVHRNGMKFVVYVSPFYSEAPDIFVEMRRVLNEYQVDGFYFDGIANDFRDSYRIIRRAREIVGKDRILYVHDSLWDSYNGLVYFPFVDTYADYILRGEGGRLGLGLQDFLRWVVSGYNIGNAVGYWVYYGSNIDDPSEQPYDYQTDQVPTTMHINAALRNEARIWRTMQAWGDQPGELERFDREYYGGLESLR